MGLGEGGRDKGCWLLVLVGGRVSWWGFSGSRIVCFFGFLVIRFGMFLLSYLRLFRVS